MNRESMTRLERMYRNNIRRKPINLVYNTLFGLAMIVLIIAFYKAPLLLWGLLMLVSVGVWYVNCCHHAIFYQLGGGIIFTVVGVICIIFGIWSYEYSPVFDIFLWLFPVWGNITLIIRKGNFDLFEDVFVKLKLTERN